MKQDIAEYEEGNADNELECSKGRKLKKIFMNATFSLSQSFYK